MVFRQRETEFRKSFYSHAREGYKNESSTAFVANLPQNLDEFGLEGVFKQAGEIIAVSIPHNQGRRVRFGFVKFKDPEGLFKSIQFLNRKVFRGKRLIVDIARRQCFVRNHNQKFNPNLRRHQFKQNSAKEKQPTPQENTDVAQTRVVKGVVNKEVLPWLLNSLVGESEVGMSVEDLTAKLNLHQKGLIKIIPLQWNKFILHFESEDLADRALSESHEVLSIFTTIKKWSGYDLCDSRAVWVEVFGVPPKGWVEENFRNIVSIWGNYVCLGSSLRNISSFESMKVLIISSSMKSIEENLLFELEGEGVLVNIAIKECSDSTDIWSRLRSAGSISNDMDLNISMSGSKNADPLNVNNPLDEGSTAHVSQEKDSSAEEEEVSSFVKEHCQEEEVPLEAPIPNEAMANSAREGQPLPRDCSQSEEIRTHESVEKEISQQAQKTSLQNDGVVESQDPQSGSNYSTRSGNNLEARELGRAEGKQPVSSNIFSKEASMSSGPPPGFELMKSQSSIKKKGVDPLTFKVGGSTKLKKVLISKRKRRLSQSSDNSSSIKTSDSTMRMVNDALKVRDILGIKTKKNPEGVKKNMTNAIKDHKRMRVGPSGV